MTPQEFSEHFERRPPRERETMQAQLERLLHITAPSADPLFNQFDRNFLKTLRISAR